MNPVVSAGTARYRMRETLTRSHVGMFTRSNVAAGKRNPGGTAEVSFVPEWMKEFLFSNSNDRRFNVVNRLQPKMNKKGGTP